MTRLAMIVRSDNRGLGGQTRAMHRWLRPAKTLLVQMGRWTHVSEHPEWYPDARTTQFDGATGTLDLGAIHWALTDVDVLLSVETPYDYRIWSIARDLGVGTVLVANPEFYRADAPDLPGPDIVVNPSPWRSWSMPGCVQLDQPIDRQEFPFSQRGTTGRTRFLHVVGRAAAHDRQGTDLLVEALRFIRGSLDLTIRSQGPLQPQQRIGLQALRGRLTPPRIEVGDVPDPAMLYADADVLIAPRRFGGNHMPLLEARSMGLAVLATDRLPENEWLPSECLVQRRPGRRTANLQGGVVDLEDCRPEELAKAIMRLRDDPDLIDGLSAESDGWAESRSWPALLGEWQTLTERAALRSMAGAR